METSRKCLILSNLPQRDRANDEFLASKLREKNFEVRVTPFLPDNRLQVLYYKPDVVILPEARCEYTIDFAMNCMRWGVTTIIKRTEGGAAWGAWNKMEQSEKDTVVGSWPYDADLEIVWSEKFADLVAKHGHIPKRKLFVCGGIPFDLYFQGPKIERPKDRKSILFAPGWGHADRSPDYNVPEAPPGSPIHRDAYERHRFGRDLWIEMITKAYDALPGWDFYIRLKTGEQPKEYQDKLKGKIKIVMPCPAKIALEHTDLLVHAGSTLAIEAHLTNMPALSFCGTVNQVPGYEYPHVSPDFQEDADALIKAIKKVELGKSNANLESIKILEREFYGTIDGKACDRIADKIASLELKPTCIPYEWPKQTKDYYTPGVYKMVTGWICETCHQRSFTDAAENRDMIKCPYCGISLARKLAGDDIMDKEGWAPQPMK